MFYLHAEVEGKRQLSRALEIISDNIQDFTPAFEEMEMDFYQTQQRVFLREGSFEGLSAWAALSPRYAAWKRQHFPGRGILELTGELRASLTRPSAPGSIRVINPDWMEIGTKVRTPDGRYNLGLLHQRGTSRMPARPPLRLTKNQRKRWVSIAHRILWFGKGRIEDTLERHLNYKNWKLRVDREP